MTNIVRDAFDDLTNSEGRSLGHAAIGVGLFAAALIGSAVLASRYSAHEKELEPQTREEAIAAGGRDPKPRPVFSFIWPPLFLTLAFLGVRIWNAEDSEERTQALGIWGAIQALNAGLTVWAPRDPLAALAANVAALGAIRWFGDAIEDVDPHGSGMISPFASVFAFARTVADGVSDMHPDFDIIPEPATAH